MLEATLTSPAFQNAFWVFVGIVAGAIIQYILAAQSMREHRANARRVLETEVALNLSEAEHFKKRLSYIKERLAAGQISDSDLFVTMHGFDYSAITPIVNSGHFHTMLSAEGVRRYLQFMRFFNNENAKWINSMFSTEHGRGKSMDFIDWLFGQVDTLCLGLQNLD